MGYFDISIDGSDTAFDLAANVKEAKDKKTAIELLAEELKSDNGPYNTPGCVNVALILTDGDFAEDFKPIADQTLADMRSLVATAEKEEWDTDENKEYHLTTYNALIEELTSRMS